MILFLIGVLIGLAFGVGTAVAIIANQTQTIKNMQRDLTVAGWRGNA